MSKRQSRATKRVLCHGCFQVLHNGHLELFKKAKKIGYVIVGLESDYYIYNKKNKLPRISILERKKAIESTGLIDEVIILKENQDYQKLYSEVKPDILITARDEIVQKKINDARKYNIDIIVMKKINSSSNYI